MKGQQQSWRSFGASTLFFFLSSERPGLSHGEKMARAELASANLQQLRTEQQQRIKTSERVLNETDSGSSQKYGSRP